MAPSTAISFSFCRICQTSRPLRRIFSSSAAVFRTIICLHRPANLLGTPLPADRCCASTSTTRRPAARKYSSTGRVCRSYASNRSRITGSRSSSRTTSSAPSRSHTPSRCGGWKTTLYRVPQRGHCAASGQTGNNYIVINREMNHHLADPALRPASRTDAPPAPACAGNHPGQNPWRHRAAPAALPPCRSPLRRTPAPRPAWWPPPPAMRRHPAADPLPQHIPGRDVGNAQALRSAASPACLFRNRASRTGRSACHNTLRTSSAGRGSGPTAE